MSDKEVIQTLKEKYEIEITEDDPTLDIYKVLLSLNPETKIDEKDINEIVEKIKKGLKVSIIVNDEEGKRIIVDFDKETKKLKEIIEKLKEEKADLKLEYVMLGNKLEGLEFLFDENLKKIILLLKICIITGIFNVAALCVFFLFFAKY